MTTFKCSYTDMLTKDEIWINRSDMTRDYSYVLNSIPDDQLRTQLSNYVWKVLKSLPQKATQADKAEAIFSFYREYPELIDYYIRFKEDNGDKAVSQSERVVQEAQSFYIYQLKQFVDELHKKTGFYLIAGNTYQEARERALFLKDVVENKGGFRIFYKNAKPIRSEQDLHILYRLTWFATLSDVSREVDDGRGPADFKISKGASDKTLVEFKLASNTQLEKNLQYQVPIYQEASDADRAMKVIFFFTRQELERVNRILKKLKLTDNPDIILVDARKDNKPSGSKAGSVEPQDFTFDDLNFDFGNLELDDFGERIDK